MSLCRGRSLLRRIWLLAVRVLPGPAGLECGLRGASCWSMRGQVVSRLPVYRCPPGARRAHLPPAAGDGGGFGQADRAPPGHSSLPRQLGAGRQHRCPGRGPRGREDEGSTAKRAGARPLERSREQTGPRPLAWAFVVERVTGSNPRSELGNLLHRFTEPSMTCQNAPRTAPHQSPK